MKQRGNDIGGQMTAAVVLALLLLVAVPVAYVIGVLIRTGSRRLLMSLSILGLVAVVTGLTHADGLLWLMGIVGVGVLVLARREDVGQRTTASTYDAPTGLPVMFKEDDW